jgi:hypothetical protein
MLLRHEQILQSLGAFGLLTFHTALEGEEPLLHLI